jgi:hypothetical protein
VQVHAAPAVGLLALLALLVATVVAASLLKVS